METTHAALFQMMLIPVLMTVVTAANAKKTNAAWRARREARAAERSRAH